MPQTWTVERRSDALVLTGEVDVAARDALLAAGQAQLASIDDGSKLIVDLGGVRFMDSSIVGALIELRGRAADRQIMLRLDPISAVARRLFTVTGLSEYFRLE